MTSAPRTRPGVADGQSPALRLPVSLVVPLRNEEETLPDLLETIDAQTSPPDEVVLVDGGSSDRTLELAERHAAGDPRYVVVPVGAPTTPGRGRNIGITGARHDWIALTDAGIRLERTWLEELWSAHEADTHAQVVFGNFEFDTRTVFEESASVAYGSPKRQTPAGRCRGPAVVSCLLHREAFEAVGGFPDLRSGEDTIFVRNLVEGGIPTAWAPDATVWWKLRPDLRSTLERFRLYSYYNVLAGQQHHWHHRLARSYVPVGIGLVLTATASPRWLLLPTATIGARVAARIRRHEPERGMAWLLRPDRLGLVAALVLANDAATAWGWCQAVGRLRAQGTPMARVASR